MVTTEMLSSVQALYVAFYGHPADPAGLQYWAAKVDANGGDLSKIIDAFSNTPEATALYGNSVTVDSRIEVLYHNLLGRDADPGGLSYWKGMVESGKLSLDNLTVAFINGAQSDGDAALVQSKIVAANAYTETLAADQLSNTVQELYVAYYGRPADVEGLKYWSLKIAENGGDLKSIMSAFSNTPEAVALYGASVTVDARIDAIYENLFGRHAEPAGLAYWKGLVESGDLTLDNLTLAIMNGAQGNDSLVVQNKLAVASAFTDQIEAGHVAYTNQEATAVGRTLLNEVTGEPGSLAAAMGLLPAYVHTAGVASADPADFATLIKGGVLISTSFVSTTLTPESLYTLTHPSPVVPGGGGGGGIPDAGDPGAVVDGYLKGATVERVNGSGNTVLTDANGNFTGLTGTGDIRIFGGIDISTGQDFKGELRAPDGSTVATPLTTLVAALVAGGLSVADATASVLSSLGLPAGFDLLNIDPVALALSGSAIGLLVQQAGVKVATLLQAASDGDATKFAELAATLAASLDSGNDLNDSMDVMLAGNLTDLAALTAAFAAIDAATSLSGIAAQQMLVLENVLSLSSASHLVLDTAAQITELASQSLAEIADTYAVISKGLGGVEVTVGGFGTTNFADIQNLNFDSALNVNLELTAADDALDAVDGTVNLNTSLAGLAGLGIDSVSAADDLHSPVNGSGHGTVNLAGFGTTSFASIAGLTFDDSLTVNLDLTDADFALDGFDGDAGGTVNLHTSLAGLSGLGIDHVVDDSSDFDSVVLMGGLGVGGVGVASLGAIANLAATTGHLPDFSSFDGQAYLDVAGGSVDINLADAIALIDAGLSFAVSVDDATMMIDSTMIVGTELGHTATLDHLGDLGIDTVDIADAFGHLHVEAGGDVVDDLDTGDLDVALADILAKFEDQVVFEDQVCVSLDIGQNDVSAVGAIDADILQGIKLLGFDEIDYIDVNGDHQSLQT